MLMKRKRGMLDLTEHVVRAVRAAAVMMAMIVDQKKKGKERY
jgi:hypothetical protein